MTRSRLAFPAILFCIAAAQIGPADALTPAPKTQSPGIGAGVVLAQVRETPVDAMAPQQRLAYIRGIQEALATHGYAPGPADGVIGPRTVRAIEAYQGDAGLAVTGRATKELLDHLKFARPEVTRGGGRPALDLLLVEDVQAELARRGYYSGDIDGLAGSRTRAAIVAFQQDAGQSVTGLVDQGLLDALISADPSIRAPRPM